MDTKRSGERLEKGQPTHEEVWLLGQPQLHEYLEIAKEKAVEPSDPATLTAEWCRANDYYQQLEELEAGLADQAELRELDPRLAPLAAEVLADPYCRETYDTVPATIGVVELDKLIAFQKCVTWTYVDRVKCGLKGPLDPETVFHCCLPVGDRAESRFLLPFRAPAAAEGLLRPEDPARVAHAEDVTGGRGHIQSPGIHGARVAGTPSLHAAHTSCGNARALVVKRACNNSR